MQPLPRQRLLTLLAILGLFAWGLSTGLHYARMGFMPLDQSVVFDGGWRTLCGQVPFRDYHTPSAVVPSLLAAPFFAVLGVGWFAYCMNAAVLNGLGALLAWSLLERSGVARGPAVVFGAATGLVLFPPCGTPFMDSESFFFSLAALALAVHAARSDAGRPWAWLAVPFLATCAYLSKQMPAALVPALALLVATRGGFRRFARAAGWMTLGTLATFAGLALAIATLDIDLERLRLWYFVMPAEVGARRTQFMPGAGAVLRRMASDTFRLGLWTPIVVHVGSALAAAVGLVEVARGARARGAERLRHALLAEALLVTCLLFVAFTNNQPEIGMGFLFVASGVLSAALAVPLARVWTGRRTRLAAFALAALATADALVFARRYDGPRSSSDLVFDAELARAVAGDLPDGLEYLRWSVPPHYTYVPADLDALVRDLAAAPGAFVLFGDTAILYGLTGKPSTMPSLWWHPRLSIPMPSDPRFQDYEDLLLESMRRHDVRRIVIEGEESWSRRRLDHFGRVMELVEARRTGERSHGPFRVIELAPP